MWHNPNALPPSELPVWGAYVEALNTMPLLTKTVTNIVMMVLSQMVSQRITVGGFLRDYDEIELSAMWGWNSAILFHYFSLWFPTLAWLHHSNVALEIPLDHLLWRVPIVCIFIVWTRWVQGRFKPEIRVGPLQAIRSSAAKIFRLQVVSLQVWPMLQIIMYIFVPVALRAVYQSTCVFFWSVFMATKTAVSTLKAGEDHDSERVHENSVQRRVGRKGVFKSSHGQRGLILMGMLTLTLWLDRTTYHSSQSQHTIGGAQMLVAEETDQALANAVFEPFSRHARVGVNHPAKRREALSNYESARESCAWGESGSRSGAQPGDFEYMWWPTDHDLKADWWGDLTSWSVMTSGAATGGWTMGLMKFLFAPKPHGRPLRSQFCVVDDLPSLSASEGLNRGPRQQWHIRRLGPFVSTGGFDWHRTKLVDPFNLRGAQGVHVTGRFLAPVSKTGEVFGNPPIHIHHANMNPEHRNANFSRIGQWHGDSQCLEEDGGTACYLRLLPDGYGSPLKDKVPVHVDADFNDVRPAGSPEIMFFLETAIRVSQSPSEKEVGQAISHKEKGASSLVGVGTLILGIPARFQWWSSLDFAGVYYVPMGKSSALWCTARLPVSGTMVSGHHYAHQGAFDEALIFSGVSPQDLGLSTPGGPFQMKEPWLPWVPSDDGWADGTAAVAALKLQVMAAFQTARDRCLSRERSHNCSTIPRLAFVLNETAIDEAGEARQMPWPDKAWQITTGEQYTTVIIHKPVKGHEGSDMLMQQHLALHSTYVPLPGNEPEFHYVLPSLAADRAWLDRPNLMSAFAHAGGPPVTLWNSTTIAVSLALMMYGSMTVWFAVACLRRPAACLLPHLRSMRLDEAGGVEARERTRRTNWKEDMVSYSLGDLSRTLARNIKMQRAVQRSSKRPAATGYHSVCSDEAPLGPQPGITANVQGAGSKRGGDEYCAGWKI